MVVVVLRLLALDFLLRGVLLTAPQVFNILGSVSLSTQLHEIMQVVPWVIIGVLALSAILLWLYAPAIARLVTSGVSQEVSLGAITLADWYSIAFIGVGLFYMTSNFALILNWCHYFFKLAASNRPESGQAFDGYVVSSAIIPFIMGIILFVNGRKWGAILARKQLKSETSAEVPPTTSSPTT